MAKKTSGASKSDSMPLLRDLCQAPGIASREDAVREVVREAIGPLTKSISVDVMGNLVAHSPGKSGTRVMIAAHTDEIGFLVSHIDGDGFVRLQTVGGFDTRVLPAQRVMITCRNGRVIPGVVQFSAKPAHLLGGSEIKPPQMDQIFVDTGMSPDDAKAAVGVGDMVTLDRETVVMGDCVVSKALDDRLGVYVMIEAIRKAGRVNADVYAVATSQEEVGLRGAAPAAHEIKPDMAGALDVTLAVDIPESKPQSHVTKLGKGVAIKIMDSSHISHPQLVDHMRDLAEAGNIPYQMEILPRGGTDAGATQRSRGGNAAITLSIPTRYVHTVNEMANLDDIQACIDLLAAFLKDAGSREYGYQ
jgi:putative aminopeptidase FrvX